MLPLLWTVILGTNFPSLKSFYLTVWNFINAESIDLYFEKMIRYYELQEQKHCLRIEVFIFENPIFVV